MQMWLIHDWVRANLTVTCSFSTLQPHSLTALQPMAVSRWFPSKMAEREGFEPPVPVRAHSISSAAP